MLIEVAYCRFYGGYAHKWKDTDRKGSRRPSKTLVSGDEEVRFKLARELGADAAVNVEKKDLFVVVKK